MIQKFKRIISLVLCFVLVLPISALGEQSMDDYSEHWAGNQIKSFIDKGFITVDKDGNFKPNDPVTRGDLAAIANKAFYLTEKDEINFRDVKSNESYYNDVLIAKKAGYFVGLPDGTVMPKGYMSRQEYALIIARLLKLDTTKYIDEANNFKDSAYIPDWSKGAIGAVEKAGYMQGEPGNVFNPKGYITRGQAVAVLERCYLDNVKIAYDKPGTYSANVIEGNTSINVRDVKLENTTVMGNLIIGEGVGDGTVRLTNVIVKGDTIVKGGGLNSVIIEDSKIKNIIVIKEDNKVRIVAVGTTTVEQVDMQSGGKLEEQGAASTGFGYVTIAESVDPNEPIILMGNFDSVLIQCDGVNLDVASGSVTNLNIARTASNAQINLGEGTNVTNMVVDSVAVVTGTGTIGTAQVNVQGTTITVPTTTTNTAGGVTVSTTLPVTTPTTTPAPTTAPTPTPAAPPSGGSSGGGGGGSSNDDDDDDSQPINKGTIELAQNINGGKNATVTINDQIITFSGELAYCIADGSNGLPISGNWVGVKITAPKGVTPDENAMLTAHGKVCNIDGVPGWDNIREEGDGDNYFHLYQRVRYIAYVYEIVIKWNSDVTETYLIKIPSTTALEYSESELIKLKDMIDDAQYNCDNATDNGSINEDAINDLGEAIEEAQAVYEYAADDQTHAVTHEIYRAQENLAAAMDAFRDSYETKIVVTASSTLEDTVTDAVYDEAHPLVLTLSIENGIGDFFTDLEDYITLGGALSEMEINSVTFEGDPANKAILELIGEMGDSIYNGTIIISEGGVNGHKHEFEAEWAPPED